MSRYSPTLLDHFQNPRNVGVMEDADGLGDVSNPQCGDTTKLFIRVRDGVIIEARWQTRGCGAAIAASSIASELVKGMPVDEARALSRAAIAQALGGLPPAKVHCSVLAADALRQAISDYEARLRKPGPEARPSAP